MEGTSLIARRLKTSAEAGQSLRMGVGLLRRKMTWLMTKRMECTELGAGRNTARKQKVKALGRGHSYIRKSLLQD